MTALTLSAANILTTSIFQSLLLVLAVALSLRLLPGIHAAVRSLIWTATFALILILPFLTTAHTPSHALAIDPLWTLPVAALWLAASLIRATQLVLSACTLHRLARTATPVTSLLTAIPRTSPLVCISDQIDRPSVVGFFSRRILLPPALYASLTPAELHHVLLHETEHLRRRDDWTNLLQKLALVLFPLNPVLLWVERRLCLERELACDDRVLRATKAPKAYASCLTHLAEHSLLCRGLSLTLGFLGSINPFDRQSELARRVHRILLNPQQAMSPRHTVAATTTILVALAGGGLTLTHAPQLIRFAVPAIQSATLEPVTTGNATFQPATFRTSEAVSSNLPARPTLVKAIMPAVARPRPVRRLKRTISPPQFRPDSVRANSVRALQANWSTDYTPTPQRLVLTTATGTQVSYTFISTVAVATPHGWIVFQL